MEKENDTLTYRTHRVGSITAGLSLIGFGVLLLLHSLLDLVSYHLIFSLWPLILVGLGLELLLSNFSKKIVYDKAAVFILIIMIFFAVGMAVTDICLQATEIYMANGI